MVRNVSAKGFRNILHYLGTHIFKKWYLPFGVFGFDEGGMAKIFGKYFIKKHSSIQKKNTKTRH